MSYVAKLSFYIWRPVPSIRISVNYTGAFFSFIPVEIFDMYELGVQITRPARLTLNYRPMKAKVDNE